MKSCLKQQLRACMLVVENPTIFGSALNHIVSTLSMDFNNNLKKKKAPQFYSLYGKLNPFVGFIHSTGSSMKMASFYPNVIYLQSYKVE